MEDDAASVERLNAAISERQTRVYGEADQRRDAHKKQVKELQDFIKTQMAEKKVERDEEGKERMRPITGGPQNLPILTRDAGVAEVREKK
jgi:TolA-binding protein